MSYLLTYLLRTITGDGVDQRESAHAGVGARQTNWPLSDVLPLRSWPLRVSHACRADKTQDS